MRRGVLTVDLDCTECDGTGRVRVRSYVPGTARIGGGPSGRGRSVCAERLCACVRPEPIEHEEGEA